MIHIAKPYLTRDEAESAYKTILSGWVTQGPRVQEFEEKFAKYVGARYAVALSSCTTALHLSMIISGIKSGDEVICPSMSFIATANSIRYVGAKPVFAEIDSESYNIDPGHAERLITDRTKGILIAHQMGLPADIDAFKKICRKYKLKLIEDAACAVGSEYKGKKIGSHSNIVCFSFHPRKVITTGDGGMIATSNKEYYHRLRILRQHGMSVNDRMRHLSKKLVFEEYTELGYNYRMTDIQAAVGIKQLEKLDRIISKRRAVAERYNKAFKGIACLRLPVKRKGYSVNYQSYPVYLKNDARFSRDTIIQKLLDKGISTRRGIMTVHREPAYMDYYRGVKLPLSENTSDRSLLLPLYAQMKLREIDSVIKAVKELLR